MCGLVVVCTGGEVRYGMSENSAISPSLSLAWVVNARERVCVCCLSDTVCLDTEGVTIELKGERVRRSMGYEKRV